MTNEQLLQEPFLETLRREKVSVSVYLINGIKLQGQIDAFDTKVILLKDNAASQIIFKHAISTIVPLRKILLEGFNEEGEVSSATA